MSRRGFLGALAVALAAPAIVKFEWIMPVKSAPLAHGARGFGLQSTIGSGIYWRYHLIGFAPVEFDEKTGLYREGPLQVFAIERGTGRRIMIPDLGHDPPCENQSAPVAYAI